VYDLSEKGIATTRKYTVDYNGSENGKTVRAAWRASEHGKAYHTAWRASEKGKDSSAGYSAKYDGFEHGKAQKKAYRTSEHGKAKIKVPSSAYWGRVTESSKAKRRPIC
jgi:hypothetical protein